MSTTFWRQIRGGSPRFPVVLLLASLMLGAGCTGGELLAAESGNPTNVSSTNKLASVSAQMAAGAGQQLFLKNCAHCHGPDAHGDDGPDLHNLDWTDEQIATRIRNGKKGQMTAFTGKLSADDIRAVIGYLRTLK